MASRASSYIGNSQHYHFIIASDCDNNNLRYMLQCNSLLSTQYNSHNYHKRASTWHSCDLDPALTNSFSSNYVLLLEKLARVVCIMVLWYANHSECRWISQQTNQQEQLQVPRQYKQRQRQQIQMLSVYVGKVLTKR